MQWLLFALATQQAKDWGIKNYFLIFNFCRKKARERDRSGCDKKVPFCIGNIKVVGVELHNGTNEATCKPFAGKEMIKKAISWLRVVHAIAVFNGRFPRISRWVLRSICELIFRQEPHEATMMSEEFFSGSLELWLHFASVSEGCVKQRRHY